LFIQFTNTNGNLSGEWDEANVVTNTDNMQQVNPFHTSFSAFLNGAQFNLNVNGRTYAGSLDGNKVTIEFPQQDGTLTPITLTPATIDDYNNAITNLRNNINQENQNTADAQATAISMAATATSTTDEQNRLNYDISNIDGAIQQLASDSAFSSLFKDYTDNLSQMQAEYQTEQHDASGGCSNAGQVSADANQISAYNNQTSADDNQFQADNNQVSTDISTVQGFVDKIKQHWSDLGKSSPGVTQNDIDTAVHKGNTAIQNAQGAVSSATSRIHGYDATSQQILQQANNLYSSMNC
jgi:chromosome segregation ATPase